MIYQQLFYFRRKNSNKSFTLQPSSSLPHPYLRRPELYFLIATKAIDRVAVVILKALDVLPVGDEVELILLLDYESFRKNNYLCMKNHIRYGKQNIQYLLR